MDCSRFPSDPVSCGDQRRSKRKKVQRENNGEPNCASQQQHEIVKKASPCVSSTGAGCSNTNRKRKRSAKSSCPPKVEISPSYSGHLAKLICPPQFIDLTNVSSSSSEKKRKCLKNPSIVDLTGLSSCGSEWKKSQYLSFGKISVSPSSSGQSSTSSLLQDLLSDCPSGASSGIDYKVFEAKYREEHLLGYGGFGSVWAGYRKGDLLPVAVKHIPRHNVTWITMTLGGRQQEVPLEVAILNIVGSGNPAPKGIVCLLDWCNLPTEVLLVLERPQPCEDLFDYISKGRVHLEEEEAKVIMRQLLEAVQLIHNRGVVHRDLKPENVLIESGSGYLHAHLIDFGCANLMEQSPFTHFRGTALYTAPEWFTENKLDGVSSTVWQLGMILYEMLHLERPFSNIKQIIENPLMLRHGLSAECQDLLRWCLEKRPQGRPTVEEIGQHPWLH